MRKWSMAHRGWMVAGAAGLAAACGGLEAPDVSEDPTSALRAPGWGVTEESRLRGLSDPADPLGSIRQVLIGPDEELLVLGWSGDRVRVFDRTGDEGPSIGRAGDGPGEFGRVEWISLRGDTILASDMESARVILFRSDGEFLSSTPWASRTISQGDGAGWFLVSAPQFVLPDGTGLSRPTSVMIGSDAAQHGPLIQEHPIPTVFTRTRSSAERIDTVLAFTRVDLALTLPEAGRGSSFPCPWVDAPRSDLMGDGSGVVEVKRASPADAAVGTLSVTVISPWGDTLAAERLAYEARPLTAEDIQREVAEIQARQGYPGEGPAGLAAIEAMLRESGCMPVAHPPVTALRTMQDGSIWLRKDGPPGSPDEWIVLNRDAEPQGVVRIPNGGWPSAASVDLLVALERDEAGGTHLVRYRLGR